MNHCHRYGVQNYTSCDDVVEPRVLCYFIEKYLRAFWTSHLFDQVISQANFLYFNPGSLFLSHKIIAHFILFLDFVEVINDYANKQVDDKLAANDHEGNEVKSHNWF